MGVKLATPKVTVGKDVSRRDGKGFLNEDCSP